MQPVFLEKACRSQGNVLFLILIAVALFAALSYAVISSTRGGTSSISDDKARTTAAQLLSYGNQLQVAIDRVRLSNGCDISQVSFLPPPFTSTTNTYYNSNAPANFRCHVFHPNGGQAAYDKNLAVQGFESGIAINGIGTTCASAECDDLYYYVRLTNNYSVDNALTICRQINKITGNPDALADQTIGDMTHNPFVGVFTYSKTVSPIYNDATSFCSHETADFVSFFRILIPR